MRGTRRGMNNPLKDRRGFLSVDFLFAMTIAAVLLMMSFAFTTTLSMIEIAQYIAFSTARAHAAGHETQEKQALIARKKFEAYQDDKLFPALAPLLKNGWFALDPKTLDIRGGGHPTSGSTGETFDEDYGFDQGSRAVSQIGVRFRMQAKILKMNIPFLGTLSEDDDFGTYVTGLLLREPTSEECRRLFEQNQRFNAILDQDSRFRGIYQGGTPGSKQGAYMPMEDNGC